MQLGRAHAAAVGHADRDREVHAAPGAPAVAPDVRDELVEPGIGEGVVLHLDDGPEAGHAEPDGGAHDPGLGERRVHAAVGAEAVAQARGDAEDAAQLAHVLAHDHDARVALQLDVQRVVDRLDERQLARLRGDGAHRPVMRFSSARSAAS